jgi:hypothetical protein
MKLPRNTIALTALQLYLLLTPFFTVNFGSFVENPQFLFLRLLKNNKKTGYNLKIRNLYEMKTGRR